MDLDHGFYDSGASVHITNDRSLLTNNKKIQNQFNLSPTILKWNSRDLVRT